MITATNIAENSHMSPRLHGYPYTAQSRITNLELSDSSVRKAPSILRSRKKSTYHFRTCCASGTSRRAHAAWRLTHSLRLNRGQLIQKCPACTQTLYTTSSRYPYRHFMLFPKAMEEQNATHQFPRLDKPGLCKILLNIAASLHTTQPDTVDLLHNVADCKKLLLVDAWFRDSMWGRRGEPVRKGHCGQKRSSETLRRVQFRDVR